MLIIGTEGISPIQKKTTLPRAAAGAERARRPDGRYDPFAPAAPLNQRQPPSSPRAGPGPSHQARTATPTRQIQELRSQVSSGEYRVDAREVAARMLLMEVDEARPGSGRITAPCWRA